MTINCLGQLIDLKRPKIMGILNITPDSFYDGGKFKGEAAILQQTGRMLQDGATFIDLGAYSSRPGAEEVTEEEELRRLEPVVEILIKEFPGIFLSIDTFRSRIASSCLQAGAALINDISGGDLDREMMSTVASFKAPYIAMHMRGTPQTMAKETDYQDLLTEIQYQFSLKITKARELKLNDLILDPGFGFAKTRSQNFELLKSLDLFQHFELPILVGLSRKSMIYKTLGTTPELALNGTTALHMIALEKGARILRVHDVAEACQCIRLFEEIRSA
ncbi:MAG: dihydropteroate synthase [Flavobacteriaceae bacterium]